MLWRKGWIQPILHIVLVQFILFFITSWCNSSYSSIWTQIKLCPQTATTTFAFYSVFMLLLYGREADASLGSDAGGEQDLWEGLLHVPDGWGEPHRVRLGQVLAPRYSQRPLRRPARAKHEEQSCLMFKRCQYNSVTSVFHSTYIVQ